MNKRFFNGAPSIGALVFLYMILYNETKGELYERNKLYCKFKKFFKRRI